MREILFRGKRIDNGEWVYGSFCMDAREQFNGLCGVDGFIRLYDKTKGKMQTYEVDRETVGQYTGLKDKNGKKIFEGDIVKRLGDKCVVKWTEEDAKFIIIGSMTKLDFSLCFAKNLEVIGNIHDNPELLEK